MATTLKLWAALVAGLYAMLAYGSYVTLPSMTGGMLGFDMRPLGMSLSDAFPYVRAITDEGRAYYSGWLRPLDTVFIMTLSGLLLAVSWRLGGWLGAVGAVLTLGYAGFDWIENDLVSQVFQYGLKETAAEVGFIADMTMAKFACLVLAGGALFCRWRQSNAQR